MSLQRYQLSAFLFALQLAGRNGSNGCRQQDVIRSQSQGTKPLPSSARRAEGLILPLPFGLSHRKGQLGKGLHSLGVACRMGTLCKSRYSLISPTLHAKRAHQCSFMYGCCVIAIACQHEVCLMLAFPCSMQNSLG